MLRNCPTHKFTILCLALAVSFGPAGCHTMHAPFYAPEAGTAAELSRISLPPYVIEPPDILLVDAISVVPKPPYRVEPLDSLLIQATDTLAAEPIAAIYPVEPEGTVFLGLSYGSVRVVGMTLEEARAAIEKHLRQTLKTTRVTVSLAQSRGRQQIRGEHLVRPDGTIGLGTYGSVHVAGMTLTEAKKAIEQFLSQFLLKPEISVDVAGYNSQVYYVITDGAGYGEQVTRYPVTGNETVLDAISQINGLPAVASKKRIWVSREVVGGTPQIMSVDWYSITQGGSRETNYQLFPGDRVYVQAEPLITLDTYLARVISPIERILGVTLLGNSTIRGVSGRNQNGLGTGF